MTKSSKLSPVKTKNDSISKCADRIIGHWRRSADSIIQMCIACAQADDELLLAPQKKQLLDLLPFSPSTFSKLVQIGKDRRLQNKKTAALLPANYSLIYPLTSLQDTYLELAIKEKVISTCMTRASLQKWMGEKGLITKSKAENDTPSCPKEFLAALVPTSQLKDETLEAFEVALQDLCKRFEVNLVKPRESYDEYAALMNQWHENIEEQLRKLARRRIKEVVNEKVKKVKLRKETKSQCIKRVGLVEDDSHVDDFASPGDIEAALDALGIGDEYAFIFSEANRTAKKPKRLDEIASETSPPASTELIGSQVKTIDQEAIDQMKFDQDASPAVPNTSPTLEELVDGLGENRSTRKT